MLQDELNLFIGVGNIYPRPNIPSDKLYNAINSYAQGVDEDDVLILVDDTLMGSAKDGLMLTRDSIYIKESFESPKRYKLENIESIQAKKGFFGDGVYINGEKVFAPTQPNFEFIELLCSVIRDNIDSILESSILDEDSGEYRILQKIKGDNLYNMTQSGRIASNATDMLNVAFAYFTGGIGFAPSSNSSEEVRREIRDFLSINVAHLRKKHIESRNIIELRNDVATLELLIYAASNLAFELQMRGMQQDMIKMLIIEGVCELFGDNTLEMAQYISERSVGFNSLDELVQTAYIMIFLSNKQGSILKDTEGLFDLVYGDEDLLRILLGDNDIDDIDDSEFHQFIMLRLGLLMREIMGDIRQYRVAKNCVDRLLDM